MSISFNEIEVYLVIKNMGNTENNTPIQDIIAIERKATDLKTFIALCNGFNRKNRQRAFDMIDELRGHVSALEASQFKQKAEEEHTVDPVADDRAKGVAKSIYAMKWDEEDKQAFDCAIYWLSRMLSDEGAEDIATMSCPMSVKRTIEKLTSICSQPYWTPSEKEMKAFDAYLDGLEQIREQLKEIYGNAKFDE